MSNTSRKLVKINDNIANDFGVRYCTNCNLTRNAEGGKWIVYANGLRRRWKCAGCVDSEKRREAA